MLIVRLFADGRPRATGFIVAIVALTCVAGAAESGGQRFVPPGLRVGDRYHLMFVSSTTRSGLSGDIADYDAHVQAAADSAGLGSSLGISWSALVSVGDATAPLLNARDRVTVGPSTPVFNMGLSVVATGFADLWDGTIASAISLDEWGRPVFGDAWTGSSADGTADSVEYLGSSAPTAWCGRSFTTDTTWLHYFNPSKTSNLHLFGISQELEVEAFPGASLSGLGGEYREDFDGAFSADGQVTNQALPIGWGFTEDGIRFLFATTTRFPADRFPDGRGIYNAGDAGAADRALVLEVSPDGNEPSLQLIVDVTEGDADSLELRFDLEAWDAADTADSPGEAAFHVHVDVETENGFAELLDLGRISTGTVLVPPEGDHLDGNRDENRYTYDSGLVQTSVPVGSRMRIRWAVDPDSRTAGWIYGVDNVSLRLGGERLESTFLRGDCNDDGSIDISDGVCILNWLFAGRAAPGCVAATNANGDDAANITDATYLLNHLFAGGPAPVAPFPDCDAGKLPADETLGCMEPPVCQ